MANINGERREGVHGSRNGMNMAWRMNEHGGMEEWNDLAGWEYGE